MHTPSGVVLSSPPPESPPVVSSPVVGSPVVVPSPVVVVGSPVVVPVVGSPVVGSPVVGSPVVGPPVVGPPVVDSLVPALSPDSESAVELDPVSELEAPLLAVVDALADDPLTLAVGVVAELAEPSLALLLDPPSPSTPT